jgi:RNA polymerase sigma-70 factor, ECF subfamily
MRASKTCAVMPDPSPGLYDDLIARIAAGDREAFGELYRRCRPDIYRYAAHMSGSAALAEDVVQDVFMAVIRDAARYRPGRSGVLPWLLGIAHNHVRRWRHRRTFVPLPLDESSTGRRLAIQMGVTTDPIGDLTRERHEAELARALLALPSRYREVIVLCDLQELSYEAAAGTLGCAIGTIRSRLHRGRARLARALCDLKSDVICQDIL